MKKEVKQKPLTDEVELTDEVDLQTCESCEKKFDIEIMHSDSECNWFCPECIKGLTEPPKTKL